MSNILILHPYDILRSAIRLLYDRVVIVETMAAARPYLKDTDCAIVDPLTYPHSTRILSPSIPVVIVIHSPNDRTAYKAARDGALAYLSISCSIDDLITAIDSAVSGHSTLSPETLQAAREASQGIFPVPTGGTLAPREIDVLRGVARAQSNKEIGEELGLRDNYIQQVTNRVYTKLGVTDLGGGTGKARVAATLWAIKHGVVEG